MDKWKSIEMSFNDIEKKLYELLSPLEKNDTWVYVLDVYDTFFIYELNGRYYKQAYIDNKIDDVSLDGPATEVVSVWKTLDEIELEKAPINRIQNLKSKFK